MTAIDSAQHISEDLIEEYVLGHLSDDGTLNRITDHVGTCSFCKYRLQSEQYLLQQLRERLGGVKWSCTRPAAGGEVLLFVCDFRGRYYASIDGPHVDVVKECESEALAISWCEEAFAGLFAV